MTLPPSFPAAALASPWIRPGQRRSLLLSGIGAVAGLVIAGFGLFTAQGTRTSAVPAEAVALVNGTPILRADYDVQLRQVHDTAPSQASAAQKREVLEQMIAEELAVQRGLELSMPTDDTDTRTALAAAVRGALASDVMAQIPSDRQLQAYYAAHADHYAEPGRMELGAYAAPSQSQARQAVAALRHGDSLAAVQARHGLRSTGRVDDGEEFYFAAALHLGPGLFAVARGLKDGAISDPVATPGGHMVLVMKRNRLPVPQAFALVRDRVQTDYTRDRLAALERANARFLRDRAEIVITPELR